MTLSQIPPEPLSGSARPVLYPHHRKAADPVAPVAPGTATGTSKRRGNRWPAGTWMSWIGNRLRRSGLSWRGIATRVTVAACLGRDRVVKAMTGDGRSSFQGERLTSWLLFSNLRKSGAPSWSCVRYAVVPCVAMVLLVCLVQMSLNAGWANSLSFPPVSQVSPARKLRFSPLHEALGLELSKPDSSTQTVQSVVVIADLGKIDWPLSIFATGTAERFGSGRFRYHLIGKNELLEDFSRSRDPNNNIVEAPCIVVSRNVKAGPVLRDLVGPECKFMLMAEEFCTVISDGFYNRVDLRQYDTTELDGLGAWGSTYVPLGPRYDLWEELNGLPDLERVWVPPSRRSIVANAIFSLSTSHARAQLARELLEKSFKYRDTSVIRISHNWTHLVSEDPEKTSTREYARILMRSIFTLSPEGHNPECYRTFEAIEAGSIPILVLDEQYRSHPCKDSLRKLRGSPVVFLDSWSHLTERLDALLADPAALDRRQRDLGYWYYAFMRERMSALEKRVISPFVARPREKLPR